MDSSQRGLGRSGLLDVSQSKDSLIQIPIFPDSEFVICASFTYYANVSEVISQTNCRVNGRAEGLVPILEISSPTIVHHMAALDNQVAPPNSLDAIFACLDAGAAFIEVDVTALADGDYLLVHDEELESETNGQGTVAAC